MIKRLIEARKREDGGFTLIELLIVITILGVLSGVVVFAVGGISSRGETEACKIDTRTLQTAEEAYRASPGRTGYTDEPTLVTEGFLQAQSTYHNITWAAATPNTYTITVQHANCGTVGSNVDGTANF